MLRALIVNILLLTGVALRVPPGQPELASEKKEVSSLAQESGNDNDQDLDGFHNLWTPGITKRVKGLQLVMLHKPKKAKNAPAEMDDFEDLWTVGIQQRQAAKTLRKVGRVLERSTVAHGVVFIGIIALGILFEVYVLKTTFNKDLSIKDALIVLGSWLCMSLVFLLYVGAGWGSEGISTWLDGYLLEMMLSVDNLFVFVLIMGSFSVPAKARSKVLMIGVLAALVLRIVMFGTIWLLVGAADIISKVLGAFIIYCAYKVIMLDDDDEEEVTENPVVKVMSSYFPMTTERDEDGSFFIKDKATGVFLAAGAMICLDVVFAVDSVSAKTALLSDQYLSYTSTGFAMFALRATYYLLDAAKDMFEHLKYGIGAILALIGVKTMLPDMFFISDLQYLFLLIVIMASCIISSVVAKSREAQEESVTSEN